MISQLMIFFLCLCILIAVTISALKIALRPYHIYSLVIRKNYETTWRTFSDPLRYRELYPHWIKDIKHINANKYEVQDQFNNAYPIEISVNQEFGVINLQIGDESSELRLFKLDPSSILILHFAKRWQGITVWRWVCHKKTIVKDFCHAKLVLERQK